LGKPGKEKTFKNVWKRSKTFKNIQKLSENIQKLTRNIRKYSKILQVLAQMVLSGCVWSTIGSAVMGNSSFDFAQDLRFAPILGSLNRRFRGFWINSSFCNVCNSLQIQKLRILDNFTPPQKKTLILVQLIGIN